MRKERIFFRIFVVKYFTSENALNIINSVTIKIKGFLINIFIIKSNFKNRNFINIKD